MSALGGLAGRWASITLGRIQAIAKSQGAAIEAAGAAVAASLTGGHRVWVTQTSHTLHTELTGRAGGLIAVHPLEDAAAIEPGDTLVVGTTAGVLFDPLETALRGRAAGATVVAIIQLAHEQDPALRVRHPSGRPLHEIADIVVDIGGRLGDGELDLPGTSIAILPSSGVTGVFAAWLIMCVAVERALDAGWRPLVYQSVLEDGAQEGNAARAERYADTRLGVEPWPRP